MSGKASVVILAMDLIYSRKYSKFIYWLITIFPDISLERGNLMFSKGARDTITRFWLSRCHLASLKIVCKDRTCLSLNWRFAAISSKLNKASRDTTPECLVDVVDVVVAAAAGVVFINVVIDVYVAAVVAVVVVAAAAAFFRNLSNRFAVTHWRCDQTFFQSENLGGDFGNRKILSKLISFNLHLRRFLLPHGIF